MLTHECKGNASYKHLSIKQENIDLYYKNKPRIFATVPLKVVLVEQRKTGKWLAEQLGKDPSTISKWCSNTTQPPLDMLVNIATLLNVDIKELINEKNIK